MNRQKSTFLEKIKNISLKWKLLILVIMLLVCCFSMMYVGFSKIWDAFKVQIASVVSSKISLTSESLEKEMAYLERRMSSISTSSSFQTTIRNGFSATSDYERYNVHQKLLATINKEFSQYPYVLSVHFVDLEYNNYLIGNDTSQETQEFIAYLYDIAIEAKGKPIWVVTSDNILFLACEIRETKNLSLENLGMIFIRIKTSALVDSTVTLDTNTDDMLIAKDGTVLLCMGSIQNSSKLIEAAPTQGLFVKTIEDEQWLITRTYSEQTGFDYFYSVSYERLFDGIRSSVMRIAFLSVILIIVILLLTVVLTRSITIPMRELLQKIEKPASESFDDMETDRNLLLRTDEVGRIAKAYQDKLEKIQELINTNYVQQLTLKETQYRSLQAQLNPHFVYNTLDSIYWMAENAQNKEIADMTLALGKLMREGLKETIDFGRKITVRKELENLDYYVLIQLARFGDLLTIKKSIPETIMDYSILRMILQPIVENAIHYGVETLGEKSTIWITGKRLTGKFEIQIMDDGIGVEDDIMEKLLTNQLEPKGSGVGLKNIWQRLQIVYGEAATMEICRRTPTGTVVTLCFPMEKGE